MHPLKHGCTSKNLYAPIFCSKYSGISNQLKLIEQVTQDQRDGKHPLSKYIVHSITMGSQKTTLHFVSSSKIKKRVPPKSWVFSQAKWGTFTIRSKPTYGLGSVSLEQLHQVVTGMTKPMTSSVVPMRKSAQGTTSSLKLQREKTQQNKNGNPSPILITKSSLRQQPILKNKL